jgi:hypothetical protein
MYILMAIVKSGNSFDEEKAIRESCISFVNNIISASLVN